MSEELPRDWEWVRRVNIDNILDVAITHIEAQYLRPFGPTVCNMFTETLFDKVSAREHLTKYLDAKHGERLCCLIWNVEAVHFADAVMGGPKYQMPFGFETNRFGPGWELWMQTRQEILAAILPALLSPSEIADVIGRACSKTVITFVLEYGRWVEAVTPPHRHLNNEGE